MTAVPPRARELTLNDLRALDDEALRTFLDPAAGGVVPATLGLALTGASPALVDRVLAALPGDARRVVARSRQLDGRAAEVADAQREVIHRLFWPLLYWTHPDEYELLIAGEHLHPQLFDLLELDDRIVCDIGAGTGRFTIPAARRARHVIAVDAIPPLLERLERKLQTNNIPNVDIRRGSFARLPLDDGSVDIAVACSSLTPNGPQGAERHFTEAERIVRDGGTLAIIWPPDPAWFEARGFEYHEFPGNECVDFPDRRTAEAMCRSYYSDEAVSWVRERDASRVPYSVLGMRPPNDVCLKRVRRK